MQPTIYAEKLEQAQQLLAECDLDAWLILVRETSLGGDPALAMIAPFDLTWESALLIGRDGTRTAIVGRFDQAPVLASGLFTQVVGYDASIGDALRAALHHLAPRHIAINYSTSDVLADGLSHGLYLRLLQHLQGTHYSERLVSAQQLIGALRACKTAAEQTLLLQAAEAADDLFLLAARYIVPGATEDEIAAALHNALAERGLTTAWPDDTCPIVNTGPASSIGHAGPTQLKVAPGDVVHIDFGVRRAGYCSDQQRVWYVASDEAPDPPADVLHVFATVRQAIERAFAFIKPGVLGYEVDAIARTTFEEAGLEPYQHALGHGVGRATHDGGVLLGPRWDRYGDTPLGRVEAGMVFTLECGAPTSCGYVGLEEEIAVEADGARWLTPPQTELWVLHTGRESY